MIRPTGGNKSIVQYCSHVCLSVSHYLTLCLCDSPASSLTTAGWSGWWRESWRWRRGEADSPWWLEVPGEGRTGLRTGRRWRGRRRQNSWCGRHHHLHCTDWRPTSGFTIVYSIHYTTLYRATELQRYVSSYILRNISETMEALHSTLKPPSGIIQLNIFFAWILHYSLRYYILHLTNLTAYIIISYILHLTNLTSYISQLHILILSIIQL